MNEATRKQLITVILIDCLSKATNELELKTMLRERLSETTQREMEV